MKVLVTGGSGRAGKYVIKELLDNGHSVVNADMINGYLEDRNPELNFKKIDFTDYGQTIFAADQCDAIIHLAAIPNPGVIPNQEVFRVNMLSTFNILEAAEEKGIEKIVLASSVNALGAGWPATLWGEPPIAPKYFPVDEKHATRNKDVYSLTKWLGEEMAESFARKRKVQISSMRFHALWDEDMAKSYVNSEKKMDLSGHNAAGFFAWTDRRDAASACRLSIEGNWTGHEAFFINGKDTVLDIPTKDATNEIFPNVPFVKEIEEYGTLLDVDKAKQILGWEPKYSWRDAKDW